MSPTATSQRSAPKNKVAPPTPSSLHTSSHTRKFFSGLLTRDALTWLQLAVLFYVYILKAHSCILAERHDRRMLSTSFRLEHGTLCTHANSRLSCWQTNRFGPPSPVWHMAASWLLTADVTSLLLLAALILLPSPPLTRPPHLSDFQHLCLPRILSSSLPLHTQPFWFCKQDLRDSLMWSEDRTGSGERLSGKIRERRTLWARRDDAQSVVVLCNGNRERCLGCWAAILAVL